MNETLFFWVDVIGIGAFAVSGYLAAVRARLDWLGVFLMAFITALGGGIMRDLVADTTPFAFREGYPSYTVVIVTALALAFRRHLREVDRRRLFIFFDAIGLSSFAITGALVALHAELNVAGVLLMALITAVGGGVIRDMLLNRIPTLLTSEFYGSIALLIGLLVWVISRFGEFDLFWALMIMGSGIALRMAAVHFGWRLPVSEE